MKVKAREPGFFSFHFYSFTRQLPSTREVSRELHFGSKLLPMEAGHLVSAETLHFLFEKYLLLFRQQQSFEN